MRLRELGIEKTVKLSSLLHQESRQPLGLHYDIVKIETRVELGFESQTLSI